MAVAALIFAASPAIAWSNGVDGPNTYGTHDCWARFHGAEESLPRDGD